MITASTLKALFQYVFFPPNNSAFWLKGLLL